MEHSITSPPAGAKTIILELVKKIIQEIFSRNAFSVQVRGSVTALVTDSFGRRIGYENGNFVNEIPDASFEAVGDVMAFYLPSTLEYTTQTIATGEGTMDMQIVLPQRPTVARLIQYQDVPMHVGMQTTIATGMANTDWTMYLGDGQTRQPDAVIIVDTEHPYQIYLPLILKNR